MRSFSEVALHSLITTRKVTRGYDSISNRNPIWKPISENQSKKREIKDKNGVIFAKMSTLFYLQGD